jgi:hypothetical protein
MTAYKLYKGGIENKVCAVLRDGKDSIPFVPDNTDYQNFKKQINADEAQLEDADGNLMTAEQAKEFVATLP